MSKLLVIEIVGGVVSGVSVESGDEVDYSIAVIDHDTRRVYREGEVSLGAEEILQAVKKQDCDDGYACNAHGYTDEDDEVEE